MEKKAIDITEKAILAINNAVNELRSKSLQRVFLIMLWNILFFNIIYFIFQYYFTIAYREEVATLIEQSVQKDDINLWFKIKEKSEQKEKSIENAEKIGKKAM